MALAYRDSSGAIPRELGADHQGTGQRNGESYPIDHVAHTL